MDTIKVSGIEFFAYHGVFESEKQIGQLFYIDCQYDLREIVDKDNIENTVSYADVTNEIVEYCTNNQFDLLESLVNNLTLHLLTTFAMIKSIEITVHKPNAPISTPFSDVSVTRKRMRNIAYLGLGSNLGDKKAYLDFACQNLMESSYINEIAISKYIETKPYGVLDQPNFMNAAAKIETIYDPYELLYFCKSVEEASGRERKRHWGERTLDIDILLFNNQVIFDEKLKIPHPEMHIRDFVLEPLKDIEPYLIHPIKGENVSELLYKLKANSNK
ncbi:2-amino-4-hydroxy-6-hydroxymethyldihydropteridine diphosphokinase [Peptostreptococcus equinus]|uniref:Bifunctional folate synthesis protein n=1 Tax=Peptostreptococcus equinus TaxID=3003601 RepID=A0ABY7JMF4_9FIRM|nr:2-amino-4-hydroxy-6-hydroxymethyldihydropteridine diphosphokinase [Peptostreptococcus sp. CBA3647]WAW14344.1 2-amino-4-hydroxy-6-hydroxymethyldihydropteridine diphosphokinase [Peptostreptococcus sp. CBA3647]